jgi:hypothetical protein
MSAVKVFEVVYHFFAKDLSKPKKPQDDKKKAIDPDGYWEVAKKELLGNPK